MRIEVVRGIALRAQSDDRAPMRQPLACRKAAQGGEAAEVEAGDVAVPRAYHCGRAGYLRPVGGEAAKRLRRGGEVAGVGEDSPDLPRRLIELGHASGMNGKAPVVIA